MQIVQIFETVYGIRDYSLPETGPAGFLQYPLLRTRKDAEERRQHLLKVFNLTEEQLLIEELEIGELVHNAEEKGVELPVYSEEVVYAVWDYSDANGSPSLVYPLQKTREDAERWLKVILNDRHLSKSSLVIEEMRIARMEEILPPKPLRII